MDTHQTDAEKQLRQACLKVTQPRITVLASLLSCDEPLTHQQLEVKLNQWEKNMLDRVTLYRVLECLVANDLAHKMAGSDRIWRFEACSRQKDHLSHHIHPHFHCSDCDRYVCLHVDMAPQLRLVLPEGFEGQHIDITVKGKCSDCNRQEVLHEV